MSEKISLDSSVHFFLFYLIANGKDNLFFPQKSSSFSNPLSPFSKTQDLNDRFN